MAYIIPHHLLGRHVAALRGFQRKLECLSGVLARSPGAEQMHGIVAGVATACRSANTVIDLIAGLLRRDLLHPLLPPTRGRKLPRIGAAGDIFANGRQGEERHHPQRLVFIAEQSDQRLEHRRVLLNPGGL
jgi:hypothetical protein